MRGDLAVRKPSIESSSWSLQPETPWWVSLAPGPVLTPQASSQALGYSPEQELICLPQ